MSSPGITIQAVDLHLQSHKVFDALSIEFAGQQIHCVLGRSGVGKSSLLNMLSEAIPIQSGSVQASNGQALKNQISHMFQDDCLLPWLSVLDNVLLGFRLRGESSQAHREKAMELLSVVDLEKWAKHHPTSLSGGMRQRVALARTLMEGRDIVLMDEPFSKLDAITRDELQLLACRLLREQTVLLVTHDPAEALRIGDTITVLHASVPSTTTTFKPVANTPRSHTDAEVLELTTALWQALSSEAPAQAALV